MCCLCWETLQEIQVWYLLFRVCVCVCRHVRMLCSVHSVPWEAAVQSGCCVSPSDLWVWAACPPCPRLRPAAARCAAQTQTTCMLTWPAPCPPPAPAPPPPITPARSECRCGTGLHKAETRSGVSAAGRRDRLLQKHNIRIIHFRMGRYSKNGQVWNEKAAEISRWMKTCSTNSAAEALQFIIYTYSKCRFCML